MAAAAQTAHRGHGARRAKVITFAAWRLLVLTALAYAAMMLLGGTAQAEECPESGCRKPASPGLVTTLTTTAHGVTEGTKTLVGSTTQRVTRTTRTLTSQPTADVPAPLANTTAPVADTAPADTTKAVTDDAAEATQAPALPAVTTPRPDPAIVLTLPSLEETVMPALTTGVELVDATTAALATATQAIEVPAIGQVTSSLAATVDRTTDQLVALGHTTTRVADQDLAQVTAVLDPVLPSLAGLGGGIDITSAANRTAGPGSAAGGDTAPAAWAPWTTATPVASPAAPMETTTDAQQAPSGGPAVPPPDAHAPTLVQSAPDTVTVLTVPVSGAGATAGGATPGGPSAPGGPELAKCLIAGFRRTDATVAGPVAVPARPLPGTPLADPSFSPD